MATGVSTAAAVVVVVAVVAVSVKVASGAVARLLQHCPPSRPAVPIVFLLAVYGNAELLVEILLVLVASRVIYAHT
jgi:hypothetical protein